MATLARTTSARTDILVGGDWRQSAMRETIAVINPSDGQTIGEIARGGAADIDAAVKAARAALDGAWGKLPAVERGRLMMKLSRAVADHHDALSLAEAADTGKPLRATVLAVADDIAAAAGLVMGKTWRMPAVIVRGLEPGDREGTGRDLIRPAAEDMFR